MSISFYEEADEDADLFGTRWEEIVVEADVGSKQISFDAFRGLNRHLGTVLQDEDWKLGTGHARQPQPEVAVNLRHVRKGMQKWMQNRS